MPVVLDGERVEAGLSGSPTLRDVIESIRTRHLGARMIVGVRINGEELLTGALSERLHCPIEPSDDVALASGDRVQVAREALREAAAELDRAGGRCEPIAAALARGQVREGVADFQSLLSVWQVAHQTLTDACTLLGCAPTEVELDGGPLTEQLAGLAEKLRELRDAFSARDFVLVTDTLYYEMPALCRVWADHLRQMASDPGEAP